MSNNISLKKFEEILVANNKILEAKIDQKLSSNNKALEEKLNDMFVANNTVLLNAMDIKIQASEKRIKQKLTEDLGKKIEESQEYTIDTLTDLITGGYDLHEDRIKRIETELNLPPLKA